MEFKGRPPGPSAGEMSHRTRQMRPRLGLEDRVVQEVRTLRRQGLEPGGIAARLSLDPAAVEKALLGMRMPYPDRLRGTLNVTLAAHGFVQSERREDEPTYVTVDRLIDELIRLRRQAGSRKGRAAAGRAQDELPF